MARIEREYSVEELEGMLRQKKLEQQNMEREVQRVKREERRQIRLKKSLGFSEKFVMWIIIASWMVIFSAVAYSYRFIASEVWSYILDLVKWLSTGTVGFFIWKARGENVIKIRNNPDYNLEEYAEELWEEWKQEHDTIGG